MHYDNQSPPGAWRQEILRNSPSRDQLFDMIDELEHCLKIARKESETLKEQNSKLIKDLTEAVASEMQIRARCERLQQEINHAWNVMRGASNDR
jgi:chromosome segregation ATPase